MNNLKCLTYTHRFLHGFKDPQFDSYGFVDSCSDGGDHPLQQLPLVLQEGSKVASSGNHLATKVNPTKILTSQSTVNLPTCGHPRFRSIASQSGKISSVSLTACNQT